MKNVAIYSTEASAYFAKLIGKELKIKPSEIVRKRFGDGELYHRIAISERSELFGKTAIFVGSTHTDQDFDELEKIGTTLAGYGTTRRIFVIPFFGYSTMERAVKPGEAVTAKILARRLSNIPNTDRGNVFLLLDLHVSGIIHYFEGNCLRFELYAEQVLSQAIRQLRLKDFVFGTADLGRTKWVETFANKFGTDIVFARKSRDFEETKILDIIGDVDGKTVLIYDDMTRSGGTLIDATDAYLERGAKEVYAALSHLALNDQSVIRLLYDSRIKKIITTNSHPMSQDILVRLAARDKIIVKDASSVFVELIRKILLNR